MSLPGRWPRTPWRVGPGLPGRQPRTLRGISWPTRGYNPEPKPPWGDILTHLGLRSKPWTSLRGGTWPTWATTSNPEPLRDIFWPIQGLRGIPAYPGPQPQVLNPLWGGSWTIQATTLNPENLLAGRIRAYLRSIIEKQDMGHLYTRHALGLVYRMQSNPLMLRYKCTHHTGVKSQMDFQVKYPICNDY